MHNMNIYIYMYIVHIYMLYIYTHTHTYTLRNASEIVNISTNVICPNMFVIVASMLIHLNYFERWQIKHEQTSYTSTRL